MKKPHIKLRDRLLAAMRACPEGKRLDEYAEELRACLINVSKAATLSRNLGQVVCMRAGVPRFWTVTEHAETLRSRCEADIAKQRQHLEDSGVLDARKARARQRKRARIRAKRQAKATTQKLVGTSAEPSRARYRWPDPLEDWAPPLQIRCVWDLATL